MLRFSTDDMDAHDRLACWRDVMGRTLTGCNPSPLNEGELAVKFAAVGGTDVRLAVTSLSQIRNNRDRDCLADGDEDLIFFSMLRGQGWTDHYDNRIRLERGDGMLARFDRTLDTSWPRGDLMLIRIRREMLRGAVPERVLGCLQPHTNTIMRLLQSYARTAWAEAKRTGALHPIAERHMAELIGSLCATSADDQLRSAGAALGAARVTAMQEAIARLYANPCLSMRDVAAGVGLSERAGHLAFEAAELNFTEEVHKVRLQRASERLLMHGERVIDIAYSVGFSDSSHFHRLFKRRFGVTPGEWRARSGT